MKNKKVLLIGSSYSAMPLLEFLKNLGCFVVVCGAYEKDPCHLYADESFYVNYSNYDNLLNLCKKEQFDYIVPSCNDYAYNAASYINSVMNCFHGFDNYDVTKILHAKNAFRSFGLENGLSVPRAKQYTRDLDLETLSLTYPLLVKPDDSFSGKGITKVYSFSDLQEAIENAKKNSRNSKVVIEEFVYGELCSHSAFICNGEICIDFFVDEFCTTYPYQVDSSCISQSLSESLKVKIRHNIRDLIKTLKLSDGLLHTQIIVNNEDFWLIETMRRCPGDLYGTLIQKTTGFNYLEYYIKPFLNQKNYIDMSRYSVNEKFIARHTISATQSMIFKSLKCCDLDLTKLDLIPLKKSGDKIEEAPYDKLGLVFYEFKTQKELITNVEKMKNFFVINTYKGL